MPHLELKSVSVKFSGRTGACTVLKSVDLKIMKGEILGLMGESGAGKTTLARVLTGWLPVFRGEIFFNNAPLQKGDRQIQMLWQDAVKHLNPYFTVKQLVAEPLACFHGLGQKQLGQRVEKLMDQVGLHLDLLGRRPHELSGGQCQRAALARVLAAGPGLLICDEPFSGLDVAAKVLILKLLARVNQDSGLTLLVISHDPLPLKAFCHRMAVMDKGRILEPF